MTFRNRLFLTSFTAATLTVIVDAHQPFVLRFRVGSDAGPSVAAELVGVPLRARHGNATYVFGVVMPFREVARAPNDPVTSFELSAARIIWTEPVPGLDLPPHAKSLPAKSQQGFQVINGGRAD